MVGFDDFYFHKGQDVWVTQADGSRRAAAYLEQNEMSAWFGAAPAVIVIYPDTASDESVDVDRVIARAPRATRRAR
jgi:hypothetical protein